MRLESSRSYSPESPLAKPFLSIVIPAFNEERRIGPTLESLVGYLGRQPYAWEVLVVDDGSSDGTLSESAKWSQKDERVRIEAGVHAGKGWAVRRGMLAATGEYRFMCDADLAMPIEQLGTFLDRMTDGYHIVVGSRQIAGARRFNEAAGRHLRGRVFNWTVRLLAVRGFDDTQCGFKCFRGDVADELFMLQRAKGLGFDVEILFLALKKDMRVLEIPIDWYHQRESKVRPVMDSLSMLREPMLVRLRDLSGKYGT